MKKVYYISYTWTGGTSEIECLDFDELAIQVVKLAIKLQQDEVHVIESTI